MSAEDQSSEGMNFQAGRDLDIEISGDFAAGDKILAENYIRQIIVQSAEVRELETQAPEEGESPFKGLQYFTEADADLFFGRSALTANLVNRLHETRFLAVVGASGSGKSSVVRAGVVPALKSGRRLPDGSMPPTGNWQVRVTTPTATPLNALAIALLPLNTTITNIVELATQLETNPQVLLLAVQQQLQASDQDRFLLVIDQFEELFTLCTNESHRQKFIEALVTTAHNSQKQITVVITLRADFYSDCLAYPDLRTLMRQYQEPIGAMSHEELLEAILRPTALHGWRIQEGLAELMLDEVGREPGGLPLLSHSLLETWHRRRGRTLTLSGYREAGGVRGAIAQTAESAYRRFSEPEQEIARTIFLRLTDLGLKVQETRRRITISSMQVEDVRPEQIRSVLQTLADARLITIDEGEVEVAHEALIREWPTLRNWLEADREGLLIHQRLEEAADEWERLGRDRGVLYRGAQLAQLEVWAEQNHRLLNAHERAFWQASVTERERRAAEREEQRLTAEKLQTQQRIGRILRWATIVVGVFLVVAIIAAVLATNARGQAEDNFNLAVTRETQANAESTRALNAEALAVAAQQTSEVNAEIALTQEAAAVVAKATSDASALLASTRETEAILARDDLAEQRLFTLSQSLAAQAPMLADSRQGTDESTDVATLLAVQAYRFNNLAGPGAEFLIDNALRQLLNRTITQTVLRGHQSVVTDVLLTADGRYAVSLDDTGIAIIWPLNNPNQPPVQLGTELEAVSLSTDGKYLYGALFLAGIGRWELDNLAADPEIFLPLNEQQTFYETGLSSLTTLQNVRLRMITALQTGNLFISTYGGLKRYEGNDLADDPQTFTAFDRIAGQSLALSQDETLLVVGGLGGQVFLLNLLATEPQAQELPINHIVTQGVAISPDKSRLFTTGADGQILVWSMENNPPTSSIFYDHSDSLFSLTLSENGRWLAAGDEFGLILMWDLENASESPQILNGHADDVTALQFSADGQLLLSGSRDSTVRLWNLSGSNKSFTAWEHTDNINTLSYAPNGTFLAFSDNAQTVNVRHLDNTNKSLTQFTGHEARIRSVAIASDNNTIASLDQRGSLRLWSLNNNTPPSILYSFTVTNTGPSPELAWHPNKMMLAAALQMGVVVWPSIEEKPLILGEPTIDISRLREASDQLPSANAVAIAFSPTGEHVAVGYLSGEIQIWAIDELADGQPKVIPSTQDKSLFGNIAFSSDGQQIAAGFDDNQVWVWSVTNPDQEPLIFEGHSNTIWSVTFDPSSRYLASAGSDAAILIWQIDNPILPPIELRRGERFIPAVLFAPDGKTLLSVENNTIYTWPLLEELISIACNSVSRNLTQQEWARYIGQIPYEESCTGLEVPELQTDLEQNVLILEEAESILSFQSDLFALLIGSNLVASGNTEAALDLYNNLANKYPEIVIPALDWNELCWHGTLNGDADLVVNSACEEAIAAAPPDEVPFYRDSRGLARALTGDTTGAIEDFTAFVDAFANEPAFAEFVEKRREWITALEAGENPFTPELLLELRTEVQE